MPRRSCHIQHACALFRDVLSAEALDEVARHTRFVKRQRQVTASSVFWALMTALGGQLTRYLSDILRTLNAQQGWSLRYKPFWDRLAQPAFPKFMKTSFERLSSSLAVRVLQRSAGSVASCFSDIRIDDGSSFAVADGLQPFFPGRFTKIKPAAVELHAHMSVLNNSLERVTLAPDKEAERQFLPPADQLPARSLSLRDRGYIDVGYFAALAQRDTPAYLICRARTDINPTIVRVLSGLKRRAARQYEGKRLQQLRKSKLRRDLELIVRWGQYLSRPPIELRLVIRYVREKRSWTWLLTNVPDELSAHDVGQLYRLRWQIELVFKDLKSDANLHGFQSEQPWIVEGFIWASLCAALLKRATALWAQLVTGRRLSTRLVAMSGAQVMPRLADWAERGFRVGAFEVLLDFLLGNALPTHPERDAKTAIVMLGYQPRRSLVRPLLGAKKSRQRLSGDHCPATSAAA